MIQIYRPGNTNFDRNGDAVLFCETATTQSEINGAWSATIECPIDPEGRWREVVEEAVLKMPSHNGEQLYRIHKVERTQYSVTADATPIFFDSADDVLLLDVRPTGTDGQGALDRLTAGTPYSGESDIEKTSTAYYIDKNLLEALSGNDENAFLKRWGGEIEYDNFTVRINSRMGADNGVRVEYGKNILENGIKQSIDTTGVITRIYPKAYNGRGLSSYFVDSPRIAEYPVVKGAVVEYSSIVLADDAGTADFDDDTITICYSQEQLDQALTAAAMADFEAGCDLPVVNFEIDMVDVLQTVQFQGNTVISLAERISLGDTVHVYYRPLDVELTERVVALEYDSAYDRLSKITIGALQQDFFTQLNKTVQQVSQAVNSDGSVKADQIAGVVGGYATLKSLVASPVPGVNVYRLADLVFMNIDLNMGTYPTGLDFELPSGYRPASAKRFGLCGVNSSASAIAAAFITMQTDGTAHISMNGSSGYVCDSVMFYTADANPAG